MAKSLTETAKAVLTGQQVIAESNDSAPDRDAQKKTSNHQTLKPGSKAKEGRFKNPGALDVTAPDNSVQDLGSAVTSPTDDRKGPATAERGVSKDTSKSSKSQVPAEKMKKQTEISEEEEVDEDAIAIDEDFEISEELEAFIAEKLEEGLSEEEIAEAIEENFELVSEDTDFDNSNVVGEESEELDEEEDEQLEEDVGYEYEPVDMSEHVEALLQGEELSEEFKEKAKTIFEAAVMQKVEEERAKMQIAYEQTLEEQLEAISNNLKEDVDDYLNYVVEQWAADNEVAIESGLRTEITEDFISGLKNLFLENNFNIPEEEVNVVESMAEEIDTLKQKLNEEIENNVELTKVLSESKRNEIVYELSEDLTDTQAEKLKSLAEGVEFTTPDEFAERVITLKENYFPSKTAKISNNQPLDKADGAKEPGVITEQLDGRMAQYARVLGAKLPK